MIKKGRQNDSSDFNASEKDAKRMHLQCILPRVKAWMEAQKKWIGLSMKLQDASGLEETIPDAILMLAYQDDKHSFAHPVFLWELDSFSLDKQLTKKWEGFARAVGMRIAPEKYK